MNKLFFCSIFTIMAVMLFAGSPLEARHHRHCEGHVQVGVRANAVAGDSYVARRYIRPAVYRPVIVAQETRPIIITQEAPAPVYVYSAPTYVAPVYVEEVHVAPRARPLTFGGLSFFLNLF